MTAHAAESQRFTDWLQEIISDALGENAVRGNVERVEMVNDQAACLMIQFDDGTEFQLDVTHTREGTGLIDDAGLECPYDEPLR